MATTKRKYLYEVDLMRCIFIFGVLANHTTSTFTAAAASNSWAYNFLVSTHLILHFTRMGFMFVTGLVLFLGYYYKPEINYWVFWKKRYKGSGIPYVFWMGFFLIMTAVFTGSTITFSSWLSELGLGLLHGNYFYLYYILVTMQLYLIFPIMVWIYRKTEGHHGLLLVISGILQLVFLFFVKYQLPHLDTSNWPYWIRNYGINVFAYQFYFMAGAYVAIHYQAFTNWLQTHRKKIYAITAFLALGTLVLYQYNVQVLHLNRHYANLIHQPYLMFYASFMILTIIALSQQYAQRRQLPNWQPFTKAVDLSSKLSFGVYLTQTASLSLLAGLLGLIKNNVSSWELIILLPFGYLIALGGAWLISFFCYKVPPFGVLVGRPQKINFRKKVRNYDQVNS
ncbi:acyltransferase [uncultured Limosilactobacillus sp.]|uniref:acyltransferase n=1 Tax=uncultured Limosilactobacillus sp. TaxID=2837629 RepID=UPI0025EDF753|nr:acyltransferase [uncultured Limosilactobacillus sp.]